MKLAESDLLICGATFAGIGAAAAAARAKRNVLVVERTGLSGHEYIEAFNPGGGCAEPTTAFGRETHEDWIRRNLMERGGPAHLPGLHPMLCRMIEQFDIQVKFLTEIIRITRQNGSYEVDLFDAAGFHRVTVMEILDTSSQRLTEPGNLFRPARRSLNALVFGPSERPNALPRPVGDEMSFVGGRFPSEIILSMTVPADLDWPQAREMLYRKWEARSEEWSSYRIAAVAGGFRSDVPRGLQRLSYNWNWLPSEGFGHPLEAVDQGCAHFAGERGICDAAMANE